MLPRPGIVAANQTGILYFLGNGDGTFQGGVHRPLLQGGGYAALATGDFNGDGRLDIAAGSADSRSGPGVILLQVPEPSGCVLVGLGLALIPCSRRRRPMQARHRTRARSTDASQAYHRGDLGEAV